MLGVLVVVLGLVSSEVVRTVYDDDPVLQSHLEEEGPGWRVLAFSAECEEEEPLLSDYCQRRIEAEGGCVSSQHPSVVVTLLSLCRNTDLYSNKHGVLK